MDHPAGQCTMLGDMCSAARRVSLDTLLKSVQAGRNGNKHAMVPTRQGVLTAAAAAAVGASVAAADASAAAPADVAWGAVKLIGADTARGAVEPTVVDNEDADGHCRRTCREHCYDLHGPLEPRHRTPGRGLVALRPWPGHGCRRYFRPSSWSPRSVSGLPPVHQARCLP